MILASKRSWLLQCFFYLTKTRQCSGEEGLKKINYYLTLGEFDLQIQTLPHIFITC